MSSPITVEPEAELVANAVRELARRTRFPGAFGGRIEEGGDERLRLLPPDHPRLRRLRPRRRPADPARPADRRPGSPSRRALCRRVGGGEDRRRDDGPGHAGRPVRRGRAAHPRRGAAPPPCRVADTRSGRAGTSRGAAGELRSIAATVDDAGIRARLAQVERRLLTLAGDDLPTTTTGPVPVVHLSPRETDVLACAALGSTNAEIAAHLGLREGTVKAYLGTAMSKLDASTRHAAVTKARRAGLLP